MLYAPSNAYMFIKFFHALYERLSYAKILVLEKICANSEINLLLAHFTTDILVLPHSLTRTHAPTRATTVSKHGEDCPDSHFSTDAERT